MSNTQIPLCKGELFFCFIVSKRQMLSCTAFPAIVISEAGGENAGSDPISRGAKRSQADPVGQEEGRAMKKKKLFVRMLCTLAGAASVLMCTVPVHATTRIMKDGELFDPEDYAARFPAAQAQVGNDPDALYQNYREVFRSHTMTTNDPMYPYSYAYREIPWYEGHDEAIQPLANKVVYTVNATELHAEPVEYSKVIGSYPSGTKLGVDAFAFEIEDDAQLWIEVVRKNRTKGYVKLSDVSVDPMTEVSTPVPANALDLAPYIGSITSLQSALESAGYSMELEGWVMGLREAYIMDQSGTQVADLLFDEETGIVDQIWFSDPNLRCGSFHIGQGYSEQNAALEPYVSYNQSNFYRRSDYYYPVQNDTSEVSKGWAYSGSWYLEEGNPLGLAACSTSYDVNRSCTWTELQFQEL